MQTTITDLLVIWVGLSLGMMFFHYIFGEKKKIHDSVVDMGIALFAVYLISHFQIVGR